MNWEKIKGNWKQFTGQAKQQWGKLTDDDLAVINGQREELAGRIQERYGYAKGEAEKEIKRFEESCKEFTLPFDFASSEGRLSFRSIPEWHLVCMCFHTNNPILSLFRK